ncbi:FAD:protein FMN transferase [Pseudochryseolinea flava]|uniref:FAD:protein FMN transferase n=1 Tax=Pseudochryseolinea flava TaxID=2059302 RepID=A0A364Y8G0_9BACT|nr:FAD:protein FMN transferase [Pseudochryseolinea flava]RAW02639.1 FAD:protein FMN transferase [Pseudochryseolinea flava]
MSATLQTEFRKQARLMGSAFEFVVVGDDSSEIYLTHAIDEVIRLEALLTEFSKTSQTAMINDNAGLKPVRVDDEVFTLIQRCKKISSLSQGAFDITAAPLKKLYNFKGGDFKFPDQSDINRTLTLVGTDKIEMHNDQHVFLKNKGMRLTFAGVGKGYAADKVKALLQQKGVESGVINASGDLTVWGKRADGSPWKVGIADPNNKSKVLLSIPLENASLATSGDYEQYFEMNGKRYSHTIDPKTGIPVSNVKSVTVVSPSAELSDALATAVFVMGPDVGMNFIEQLPQVHALMITAENKILATSHMKFNTTGM